MVNFRKKSVDKGIYLLTSRFQMSTIQTNPYKGTVKTIKDILKIIPYCQSVMAMIFQADLYPRITGCFFQIYKLSDNLIQRPASFHD